MKEARIFKTGKVVSAIEVYNTPYQNYEFISLDGTDRVYIVRNGKGNSGPYFRRYKSLNEQHKSGVKKPIEYKKKMTHERDSKWHNEWKEIIRPFAKVEHKFNFDNETRKADGFIASTDTIIEFQHSYDRDNFTLRNEFYSKIGKKVVWLYDLTNQDVKKEHNHYLILEDNSYSFFPTIDFENGLDNLPLFFESKDGYIYKISNNLFRMPTDEDKESTCRYFYCNYRYTKDEFVDKLMEGSKELYEKDKYDLHSICEFSKQYVIVDYYDLKESSTITAFVKVDDGKVHLEDDKIKLTICKMKDKSYLFNKTNKTIIKNKNFANNNIFTFIRDEDSKWNSKERK